MDIKGININGQPPPQAGGAQGPRAQDPETWSPEKRAAQAPAPVNSNKAVFVVDENDKVVIRVIDPEGNIVKQIPPEEYMRTAEVLRSTMRNLLNLEV